MAIIEENWNYRFDINSLNNGSFCEFESRILGVRDDILNRNCFKIQKFSHNNVQTHEEELKRLSEENKKLRHEIESKLAELAKQKSQYETYKQDQKLLSKEIKDTHEAFLMAKKYYKKYLKIYYTIESRNGDMQTIYLQFFTESKKDTDIYSVRLAKDTKANLYVLLETKPKLASMKELKAALQETKDLPGTLCKIRQAFMEMKCSKQ